jgi:NAD(P)-dependent dehydrogenase (short-subunit alcohol dehydrogenase family)
VDILVNNAGIAVGGLAFDETFEGFWKAVEVNFKGTMLCVYEVLRGMKERRSGCIVNMASRAATVDMAGGLSYNSSKAAVARATHSLQEEFEQAGLGEQLHTYCLHPGGVWGKMVTGELSYLSILFCLDTGNETSDSLCVCREHDARSPSQDQAYLQGRAGAVRQHGGLSCFWAGEGAARMLLRLSTGYRARLQFWQGDTGQV